jgi:hypothetical protein
MYKRYERGEKIIIRNKEKREKKRNKEEDQIDT